MKLVISNKVGAHMEAFVWVDRKGKTHLVNDMTTRHLFHVVRMVWNHSAPEYLKLTPYQPYKFKSIYTPLYMGQAIRYMYHELMCRPDVTREQKIELDFMQSAYEAVFSLKLVRPSSVISICES